MLDHVTPLRRILATAVLLAAAALPALATTSMAATDGVACGMVSAYTAPDPAGPTDGMITIGLDQVETIAATATLSANLAANLPAILNSSPTCLAISTDSGGVITALDFAPTGTVCGTLELDPSGDFYVVARAFIIPVTLVDSEVAFSALFGVSFASGGEACVTFTVDTTTGAITAFSGTTSVCGAPVAHPDGSLDIGPATIPTGVVSPNGMSAEAVAEAAHRDVCADIRSAGTVDTNSGAILASAEAHGRIRPLRHAGLGWHRRRDGRRLAAHRLHVSATRRTRRHAHRGRGRGPGDDHRGNGRGLRGSGGHPGEPAEFLGGRRGFTRRKR